MIATPFVFSLTSSRRSVVKGAKNRATARRTAREKDAGKIDGQSPRDFSLVCPSPERLGQAIFVVVVFYDCQYHSLVTGPLMHFTKVLNLSPPRAEAPSVEKRRENGAKREGKSVPCFTRLISLSPGSIRLNLPPLRFSSLYFDHQRSLCGGESSSIISSLHDRR